MFKSLTDGFRKARQKLTGMGELTDDVIDAALRDVRLSLLEADVELNVTKRFLARVKEKMLGQRVKLKAEAAGRKVTVTPEQVFIKACEDELVAMMTSGKGDEIEWAPKGSPTLLMMVGLQGQGKTTSSAKIARLLAKQGKKVLLVAADLQRPAAVEQLQVLGKKIDVPVFAVPGSSPVEVCKRALAVARVQKKDVVILDTAGRLAIDMPLMEELRAIKSETKPNNILLVVNAAIGQNALATAQAFHDTLGLTGVVMTMLDGDARGGAALSIREVTGVPIKFAGTGEQMDKMEPFRPEGMASRILGMGDIVGLVKDFSEVVDQKKAEDDALRMLQGQFGFDDFVHQIETIQKMGPLQELFEKMPFFADALPPDFKVDEKELDRVKAIINSMTRQERNRAELFKDEPTRLQRVARGAAVDEKAVAELVAKFLMMRDLMGGIGQQAGLLGKMPGMKQLAMARKLRDMVKVQGGDQAIASLAQEMLEAAVAGQGGGFPGMPGGFPGMPGMGGMPGGFPGMPGMGGMPGGFPGMGNMSNYDPQSFLAGLNRPKTGGAAKPKDKRKSERDARKKNRKK
ncbi:MAG: signal recognition particle protein [Myxococcales bacterium]|nr:signal recognition particle protein [Myxococcales bacterium]